MEIVATNVYNIQPNGNTLHAVRWGQNFPNPNGGVILRSKLTTSRCFIRPLSERGFSTNSVRSFESSKNQDESFSYLASGSYSDQSRTNSSK